MLGLRNVFGRTKATQSAKPDAWLTNLTARLEFLPNGGLPMTMVFAGCCLAGGCQSRKSAWLISGLSEGLMSIPILGWGNADRKAPAPAAGSTNRS